MKNPYKVLVNLVLEDDDGNEQDYIAIVKVFPGTNSYLDKEWGNWLPGDPGEFDILEIYLKSDPKVKYDVSKLTPGQVEYISQNLTEE